jgi:hypothetical protein
VRNSVPAQNDAETSENKVSVHARTRHGDIVIHRAAAADPHDASVTSTS